MLCTCCACVLYMCAVPVLCLCCACVMCLCAVLCLCAVCCACVPCRACAWYPIRRPVGTFFFVIFGVFRAYLIVVGMQYFIRPLVWGLIGGLVAVEIWSCVCLYGRCGSQPNPPDG